MNLHVLDAEPIGKGVISLLEDALQAAKAGEVSSVALALVRRDGTMGQAWSDAPSLSCLVGAVTRMQFALLQFAEE
jgi:hypothetical protein